MLKDLQCVKMELLAPIASVDLVVSASTVGQGWTVALTSMIVQGRLVSMGLLVLTEWGAFIVGVRLEKLVSTRFFQFSFTYQLERIKSINLKTSVFFRHLIK